MNKLILFIIILLSVGSANAQEIGWQLKDPVKTGVYGISHNESVVALKNKKAKKIIIAIIDTGIDTLHNDLSPVLWTDPKTGIHGWNYIGAETGREDVTLIASEKKGFYDSLALVGVSEQHREGYQRYRKGASALQGKIADLQRLIHELSELDTEDAKILKKKVEFHLVHGLNIANIETDTATGDSDIAPDVIVKVRNPNSMPMHGTHVAGIIGGTKHGIANNVELMMLKTNGNIRELRDRALARAIRFAVDHGASVVNCSFGKPYSWAKRDVDEAVAYAKKKDVLIIHAAGNDDHDNDQLVVYPRPEDKSNWIVVGASDEKGEKADFSNYGEKHVDLFAPGVKIYSTIPDNKYLAVSGTSMAAPVVVGIAAMIRGYYPLLSASQVKEILMKSVVKRDVLKYKCVSGGIVNADAALKLAATYKPLKK